MSNYKPRIESNNLDLTSILSTINELPDVGGGSTSGACTIDIICTGDSLPYDQPTISHVLYFNPEGEPIYQRVEETSFSMSILSGTCFYASFYGSMEYFDFPNLPNGFVTNTKSMIDGYKEILVIVPDTPGNYTITIYGSH